MVLEEGTLEAFAVGQIVGNAFGFNEGRTVDAAEGIRVGCAMGL